MPEFAYTVSFFSSSARSDDRVTIRRVPSYGHRPCPTFTWIPPFSKKHHRARRIRRRVLVHACTHAYANLRAAKLVGTIPVPEVANGWPTRLFEMEVSNSRVK